MDEMVIQSLFTRKLVSIIIGRAIKKKTGKDVKVDLGNFTMKISDETATLHLETDIEMTTDELRSLVMSVM